MSKSTIESDFQQYIQNFSFDKYQPFIHGTTKERAKQILKHGLKIRKDQTDKSIAEKNIWGSSTIKSEDDKIYFKTCMEVSGIDLHACEKAYKSDNNEPYYEKYKDLDDFQENGCSTIKIKHPEKYYPHFTLDEDSKGIKKCLKRLYSDDDYKQYEVYDCISALTRSDDQLVNFYEQAFVEGGNELVSKLIDQTPEAIFSIIDWGTIAVDVSIPPEDLEEIKLSSEDRENMKCRMKNKNQKFFKGNDTKYVNDKNPVFKAYLDFSVEHTKENAKKFKEFLKTQIK